MNLHADTFYRTAVTISCENKRIVKIRHVSFFFCVNSNQSEFFPYPFQQIRVVQLKITRNDHKIGP
jgi:hypothetical protein